MANDVRAELIALIEALLADGRVVEQMQDDDEESVKDAEDSWADVLDLLSSYAEKRLPPVDLRRAVHDDFTFSVLCRYDFEVVDAQHLIATAQAEPSQPDYGDAALIKPLYVLSHQGLDELEIPGARLTHRVDTIFASAGFVESQHNVTCLLGGLQHPLQRSLYG